MCVFIFTATFRIYLLDSVSHVILASILAPFALKLLIYIRTSNLYEDMFVSTEKALASKLRRRCVWFNYDLSKKTATSFEL